MGAGLPVAMMPAMLHPDRLVMAVCGDDGAYGMIRWRQAVDSFPDYGLTFGNPDFVRYAESYGAKGTRVTSTEGLIPAIENAFKGGGVHVVAVPIDYTENTRVLVDELRSRALPVRAEPMPELVS